MFSFPVIVSVRSHSTCFFTARAFSRSAASLSELRAVSDTANKNGGGSSKEKKSSHTVEANARFDYGKIKQELFQIWMNQEAKFARRNNNMTTARYCCFTYHDALRAYQDPKSSWHWLDKEMSSNLAGETGAVAIYTGALAAMTLTPQRFSSDAVEFCHDHQTNERAHLRYFTTVVPAGKHTRLLPLWNMAGWVLGFVPTLVGGSRALYVTVEAVETFVQEHFQEQIVPLENNTSNQLPPAPELLRLLKHCCADEVHHKDDAARHLLNLQDGKDVSKALSSWWIKPWSQIVHAGSAFAAEVARRI